jgi:hypothetical protein
MLSIADAWIKAAIEQRTLEIVYMKANAVHETIREVAPSFTGWSQNANMQGLWGHCYLRDQIRCFKPERVWSWRYLGNTFNSQEPIHPELRFEYHQKNLQSHAWGEIQGEDLGYQQFIELEKNLLNKALSEIKETLEDLSTQTHPLTLIIEQYLNHPNRDLLTNINLIKFLTIYLEEAINSADPEDQKVLEIIKQRIITPK